MKERIFGYRSFVFLGGVLAVAALIKLIGPYDFSSDWFWFIAGVAMTIEGVITLAKQRMFDKKYKVVLREDYKRK